MSSVKLVLGDGPGNPDIVVIGEAPGKTEDDVGLPFQGRSGRLLKSILSEVYPQARVYYTNTVKVRPEANRTPTNEEIKSWLPLLHSELKTLTPKAIIAVGLTAAKAISNDFEIQIQNIKGITQMILSSNTDKAVTIPTVITYHPAYLLRNPNLKDEFKVDIKLIKDLL